MLVREAVCTKHAYLSVINMKKLNALPVVVLLLSMVLLSDVSAQQSTRGTEFFLSFLPNYHSTANSTSDSLYIYIVGEQLTKGTIELTSRSGQSRTIPFSISNPQTIYSLSLRWSDYELFGYNQPHQDTAFGNSNDNERASKQMISIHSDHDVAVYALNKADRSSDATLIFPTSSLGTEYRVLSYKSDGELSGRSVSSNYTPSEFCIVASQDDTDVQITTSCPTTVSATKTKSVRLQKGQSYLVQAQFSTSQLDYDLSGSSVTASKPVAVFAGHQRARLPENGTMSSRDCLYEQLLPLSVWGTKYVLTPLAQPVGGTTIGSDLYRVIAADDNTILKIDEKVLATLQKNEVFEAPLTQAALLTASKPVMVALFKKSSSNGTLVDGDPFMMVIPPRRQYLQSYRFTNVQTSGVYHQQYISIIVSMNDVASLRLDGKTLSAKFSSIGTSCYAYASIPMQDGAHTLTASTPFALYVYGYGFADSYGYVGGMAFYPDSPDMHLDAGEDLVTCTGKSVLLHAEHAGKSIRWTPKTGLSCDTCASTTATPLTTTSYIVSGIDSSGCVSSDTVVVHVRDISVHYSIGAGDAAETIATTVGSNVALGVYATSTSWDTVQLKGLTATIRYNPELLLFLGYVLNGDALPADWDVQIVDELSDPQKGKLVVRASGELALNSSGLLFTPVFRSLLDSSTTIKPDLVVDNTKQQSSCVVSTSSSVVIQLAACAINLRQVVISPYQTQLKSIAPNPTHTESIDIQYSLAFASHSDLVVYNTQGEVVLHPLSSWGSAGHHNLNLDLRSLSNGVYHLVLRADGVVRTQTLVIDR